MPPRELALPQIFPTKRISLSIWNFYGELPTKELPTLGVLGESTGQFLCSVRLWVCACCVRACVRACVFREHTTDHVTRLPCWGINSPPIGESRTLQSKAPSCEQAIDENYDKIESTEREKNHLRCSSFIRTIIFKWPWEYCSITSRTSYGFLACCKHNPFVFIQIRSK